MRQLADFPDVNVWVALSAPEHPFHSSAKQYFEGEEGRDLAFCWVTAMGLVRVTSRPHTFGGKPLSPKEAWDNFQHWIERHDTFLVAEPPSLQRRLASWVSKGLASANNWTDLYLAAFAAGHGMRIVTFDHGFSRLDDLDVLLLKKSDGPTE